MTYLDQARDCIYIAMEELLDKNRPVRAYKALELAIDFMDQKEEKWAQ